MISLHLGRRPDGSSIGLARPHGGTRRVGFPAFRAVFISVGAARAPRTCIYRFLDSPDRICLQRTNARLLLFLAFSSSSAVGTPRKEFRCHRQKLKPQMDPQMSHQTVFDGWTLIPDVVTAAPKSFSTVASPPEQVCASTVSWPSFDIWWLTHPCPKSSS